MIGKIFGVFAVLSAIYTLFTGGGTAFSSALFTGAENTVSLLLSLGGMMCLWNGVLEVMKEMGIIDRLANRMRRLFSFLFPTAAIPGHGVREIAASFSANLLGIGNAATPLGIRAMQEMQKDNGEQDSGGISDDMALFVVMNTVPPAILPTTLLTLRHACGSADPFAILPPLWLVSFLGTFFAVAVTKAMERRKPKRLQKSRNPIQEKG